MNSAAPAPEHDGGVLESGYRQEILRQRAVWLSKPLIRTLYQRWYRRVVDQLSPVQPCVEVGAGCGNFKEFHPQTIATDVYATGPWIDRVMDAHHLDFAQQSLGNIVAFDVIHHLQRPLEFLRQASRLLKPGGRLVLCEPAVTPWSRLVYSFHHEAVDPSWDLFGLDASPPLDDPQHAFANMAIAHLLFRRHARLTSAAVPGLRMVHLSASDFLLYALSGGFSYRSYLPHLGIRTLLRIEELLTRPFASWLTGLRLLVVLEKQA